MKVVNAVKLKEEVDYESLCRKLEYHVDYLTSETDRQQKLRENEKEQLEKKMKEKEAFLVETEKKFSVKCEVSFISLFCFWNTIFISCCNNFVYVTIFLKKKKTIY